MANDFNRTLSRRHLLQGCCGAMAVGLFSGLLNPAQAALRNPCRDPFERGGEANELVFRALEGLDTNRLVDTHAHLLGNGDAGSGCTVSNSMYQWWRPTEIVRRKAILNASCVDEETTSSVDRAYVQRLNDLANGFPSGARWWLFAFDQAFDDKGNTRPDWTTFFVPNSYTAQVAQQLTTSSGRRFEWVASIHPYRADALQQLQAALQAGAVAVKWLPSAMNIDPHDLRCRPFCEAMARAGVPLIVHFGEEKAVPGAGREAFCNPLLARPLMEHGVKVIAAHCGSLGHADDTDKPSTPRVPAFELFARLMDEKAWEGRLLGDISAVFQRNRKPNVWRSVIERQDWHHRLLHGSDHPLPGLMPLFSLPALQRAGVLKKTDVEPLQRLREHNPLLFDLTLKRRLRLGDAQLPASIFEGKALG